MEHRPTIAKIDLDALAHNLREMRKFVGKSLEYMAVVKADAYGHDAAIVTDALQSSAAWFAVSSIEEAAALPRLDKPVLVMRPIDNAFVGDARSVIEQHVLSDATAKGVAYEIYSLKAESLEPHA